MCWFSGWFWGMCLMKFLSVLLTNVFLFDCYLLTKGTGNLLQPICLLEASASAAELRQLPLEEIQGRCPEEVEDSRMYVSWFDLS